jgi:hypothetical protein
MTLFCSSDSVVVEINGNRMADGETVELEHQDKFSVGEKKYK